MSGVNAGGIAKREQHRADRGQQRGRVAARKIRAPDRAGKQRVSDKEIACLHAVCGLSDLQADTAGTMARRVVWPDLAIAEGEYLSRVIKRIDGRERRTWRQAEHPRLIVCPLVEEQIVRVKPDRNVQCALGRGNSRDVIDVRVREKDVGERDPGAARIRQQRVNLVAGIDEHAVLRPRTGDNEAVLEEGRDGPALDYDHVVILAIVDDLLFASKIKTAAKLLGVAVAFARSPEAALAEVRAQSPSLVIFDLNSRRTDPLGTIAALKSDPALRGVPTLGFVSHVQADLIDAARQAGIDEVMARSAFVERLPDILTRAT